RFPIEGKERQSFLVWTTTPWTLPANVSLAVNPELDYVRAKVGDEVLIVSQETFEQAKWPDAKVLETLKGRALLGTRYRGPADYTHRYPECWRCHEEIVFRVADEWFISMDDLRPKLIDAAAKVTWLPPAAGRRMQNWLQNMGDWNISRKRYWGLPLPFYTCANGHFFVLGSEEELRERARAGLEKLRELHRPWIDDVIVQCPECAADSKRVKEVGDCWLDAGVVPFSTL